MDEKTEKDQVARSEVEQKAQEPKPRMQGRQRFLPPISFAAVLYTISLCLPGIIGTGQWSGNVLTLRDQMVAPTYQML